MDSITTYIAIGSVIATAFVILVLGAALFRRIVKTNTVHIVQRRHKTMPYGTGQTAGNVYYRWPTWWPYFGITVIELPVSNFDMTLQGYEAYDKDRVPFEVDVTAFFRIADTAIAAQRIAGIDQLKEQLGQIVQGAVRKVLASDTIDTIMVERSKFGTAFTEEVNDQLKQWGVEPVKAMELMDIRDSANNKSISNIMAKKISHISMESRTEVANNNQAAEVAEINAKQTVSLRSQEAEEAVGRRTAEKNKQVGIADQQSTQAVLAEQKTTATAEMEVKQVQQVRAAEIAKAQGLVAAEQNKQVTVIQAEGQMEAQKQLAEGIRAKGEADGAAEQARLMAPVNAQITLAREIGSNEGYQRYLATLETINAYRLVGTAQAEALKVADVKVIANAGNPGEGMRTVMDLFTAKGGTNLGSMIEAAAQMPAGKALLDKLGVTIPDKAAQ